MKTILPFFFLLTAVLSVNAQCSLSPTITPASPILCPNSTDTLWTQVYDSYQWFKNGNLLTNDTNQYLVVSAFNDAGSNFEVMVTQDTCSATSPSVLVDSWVFLLPYVITTGDQGWVDGSGIQHNCPGDTVILELGTPYDTLIQWYNGSNPIAGATNDTLIVTQSGNYTVQGAPLICPGFVQQLGVLIPIVFSSLPVPVVSYSGAQLQCTVSGTFTYQWYLNGNPISGATASTYTPTQNGQYSCVITDANGCTASSNSSSIVLGIANWMRTEVIKLFPNPASQQVNLTLEHPERFVALRIADASGRIVQTEKLNGSSLNVFLNVSALEQGNYFVQLLGPSGEISASKFFVKL